MSGRIDLFPYILVPVALIASTTDFLYSKIFNWLTLSTAMAGLIASSYFWGFHGLTQSILGFFAGFFLFGWIYSLGQMGAGDVKYLMALGAWGGPLYSLDVALYSILMGGVLSLASLIATGRFLTFSRKLSQFFLSLWIAWSTQTEAPALPKMDSSLKIPFGIPISIAAIWIYFFHPLKTGGLFP